MLLNENGEWIGIRLVENITLDEFREQYPPVDYPTAAEWAEMTRSAYDFRDRARDFLKRIG